MGHLREGAAVAELRQRAVLRRRAGAAGAERRARPQPDSDSHGQAGKERVAVLARFQQRGDVLATEQLQR